MPMRRWLPIVLLGVLPALLGSGPPPAARPTLTRVLFLYGSVPPGTDPGEMIRLGNAGHNGYAPLAALLYTEQGANLTELADTDPAVDPLTAQVLAPYNLIVLGSNNRRFSAKET